MSGYEGDWGEAYEEPWGDAYEEPWEQFNNSEGMTMTEIYYQEGSDAALVVNFGESNQAVVKGLNKISGYSLERGTIEVEEFRNDLSRKFAGGGKLGTIPYGGNAVLGDENGQDELKALWLSKAKVTNMRVYFDNDHFFCPDLAQDSISAFQVLKCNTGQGDKNGVFPYDGELCMNGRPATFYIHMEDAATPTITFTQGSGADDTITDSASGFVAAGFKAGMSILIDGNPTNKNKYGVIKTVTAGTITLDGEGLIDTDGTGSALTVIHGGKL